MSKLQKVKEYYKVFVKFLLVVQYTSSFKVALILKTGDNVTESGSVIGSRGPASLHKEGEVIWPADTDDGTFPTHYGYRSHDISTGITVWNLVLHQLPNDYGKGEYVTLLVDGITSGAIQRGVPATFEANVVPLRNRAVPKSHTCATILSEKRTLLDLRSRWT